MAAFSCGMAFSAEEEYLQVSVVPFTQYLTDIHYDAATHEVTFTDTYKPGETDQRTYNFEVYERRNDCHLYQITNPIINSDIYPGKVIYSYGYLGEKKYGSSLYGTRFHANTCWAPWKSEGGEMTFSIDPLLNQAYRDGITKLWVAIQPSYGTENLSYEDEQPVNKINHTFGSHLNNHFEIDLPLYNQLSLVTPHDIRFGESFEIMAQIQGQGQTNYYLQESMDGENWRTVKSGTLSAASVRTKVNVSYHRVLLENGINRDLRFRLVAQDVKSKDSDTSDVAAIPVYYKWTLFNELSYVRTGDSVYIPLPQDCSDYRILSDLPFLQKKQGSSILCITPACNATLYYIQPKYKVTFLDADYREIRSQNVLCGDDAVAPPEPSLDGMKFKKWSKDFTNVHKDLTVIAQYDLGENYSLRQQLASHSNPRYPAGGFAHSERSAMVGDSLTFRAWIRTPVEASVRYQQGLRDAEGNWTWGDPKMIGSFTAADVETGEEKVFEFRVSAAYEYGNEMAWRYGEAYRFNIYSAGTTLLSDPYEFDIYYPLNIHSLIEDGSTLQGGTIYESLTYESNGMYGYSLFNDGLIPARYKDTVHIYRDNGGDGACLLYARVNKPARDLDSGLDEQGDAYILGPGEVETVNVNVSKKVIVFEVPGQQKQWDFSAQGLGKHNGYYAEVVNCGGSIQHMPEDPSEEGSVFIGWKNETTTEYADDAYMNVPAVDDNRLTFTVQWEEIPEVPQYAVKFYGKDGAPLLLDTLVNEGDNAVPPIAPEIDGFHFTGWDKPYTTITADVDIIALYGEDAKGPWLVTYFGVDGETKLGEELVADGAPAIGLTITQEGKTFHHWENLSTGDEEDLQAVTKDMDIKAVMQANLYTLTYLVEGAEYFCTQVEHGYDASQVLIPDGDPVKEKTLATVYTFDHWSPTPGIVTSDMDYEAVFAEDARLYNVVFRDWDQTELGADQVPYGGYATAPADPSREGYKFIGWDNDFSEIKADLVVTALYEQLEEKKDSQGFADIISPTDNADKYIIDGSLFIALPDGEVFNAQGQKIK